MGGDGNDTLYGNDQWGSSTDKGNDILRGGNGADKLFADRGKDVLYGEAGDDRLTVSDYGQSILWGGAGKDQFIFNPKGSSSNIGDRDIIMDFRVGDKVNLVNLKIDERADISIKFINNAYIIQDVPNRGEEDLYITVHSDHKLVNSDFIFQ